MIKALSSLVVLSLACSPVRAFEWHARGARALGMGGAGVATAAGPLAAYWNPAALGRTTANAYGIQIPFGVHAGLTGSVIEGAKNLQKLKDTAAPTQGQIDDALAKLDQPGNGLRIDGDSGTNLKIGRLGVFSNGSIDVGVVPQIDRVNTGPAAIQNGTNNSKLIIKGASILEFGAAYGREVPVVPGLYLGGALKAMNAQVGYADYFILHNDQGNIINKPTDGAARSSNLGIDFGILWDLDRTFDGVALKPRVGLVGRNLNNPKFKQSAAAVSSGLSGKFAINPQIRMGVAISPFAWWNLAADMDLTRNLTPVDNVSSRQIALGSEFNVFNRSWINIPLRLGLRRNTAETSAGTVLTAGAGLNFLHIIVDASAAVSNKSVLTQSQGKETRIPREVALGIQLSVLFGGSAEDGTQTPRDWKSAPHADNQPMPTEAIRKAAEKAHEDLKKEGETPSTDNP